MAAVGRRWQLAMAAVGRRWSWWEVAARAGFYSVCFGRNPKNVKGFFNDLKTDLPTVESNPHTNSGPGKLTKRKLEKRCH
jgi:hypothetical protein